MELYKGWRLTFSSQRPIDRRWRAEKNGIPIIFEGDTLGAVTGLIDRSALTPVKKLP